MYRSKNFDRFIVMCSTVLLALAGPVLAGAPAPSPTGGGPHPEHLIAHIGDVQFENGQVVKDFKVSYVTHGTLNKKQDNVVVALQHFFGDHHDYDLYIGPGKALDTDKYFIVASDFIASAGLRGDMTTGPTNSGLKMEFPPITPRDWVNLEYKLLKEYLGIDQVRAVVGSSIGAMNSYQFAVSYPDYIKGAIPIAGGPKVNPQMRALIRSSMGAITLDSGWHGGNYQVNPIVGSSSALMMYPPWIYTAEWFTDNLTTDEKYRAWDQFWRTYWTIIAPQDARDLYYQMEAWSNFDIGTTPGFNGSTEAALRSIKARMLVLSIASDMQVQRRNIIETNKFISNLTHVELESPFGHAAYAGFDPDTTEIINREIAKFLANLR